VNETGGALVLVLVVSPAHEINPPERIMVNSMIATLRAKNGGVAYSRREDATILVDISNNAAIIHHTMILCNGSGPLGNLWNDPKDGLEVTCTVRVVVAFPFAGTVT
jgi:hypothetical protein